MPLLSKEQILTANDLPFEDVPVPEWGGTVRVHTLPGEDRDRFESGLIKDAETGELDRENVRARLASLAIVDEQGKRLFTESDVAALGRKNSVALTRVYDVAARLSGLRKEDVEELAKNSNAAPQD